MQPRTPEAPLRCVVTDDGALHFPKDGAVSETSVAACGARGESSLYCADEYTVDADWCDECAGYAETTNEMVSAIEDAFKDGIPDEFLQDIADVTGIGGRRLNLDGTFTSFTPRKGRN